ncbi:unnamed protein product, partial [Rotaria socialis]
APEPAPASPKTAAAASSQRDGKRGASTASKQGGAQFLEGAKKVEASKAYKHGRSEST